MGAIDELVDQHESAGRQFLLEGAAGRQRDQVGDPGTFQHVDIGAVVDIGRRQPVTLVVARQKHDRQSGDVAVPHRRRRFAPRAGDRLLAHVLQPRQVINAGTADNAKNRLRHLSSLPAGKPVSACRGSIEFRAHPSVVDLTFATVSFASRHSECQIQNHTRDDICWCPFGSDIRKRGCCSMIRMSEPGHQWSSIRGTRRLAASAGAPRSRRAPLLAQDARKSLPLIPPLLWGGWLAEGQSGGVGSRRRRANTSLAGAVPTRRIVRSAHDAPP